MECMRYVATQAKTIANAVVATSSRFSQRRVGFAARDSKLAVPASKAASIVWLSWLVVMPSSLRQHHGPADDLRVVSLMGNSFVVSVKSSGHLPDLVMYFAANIAETITGVIPPPGRVHCPTKYRFLIGLVMSGRWWPSCQGDISQPSIAP